MKTIIANGNELIVVEVPDDATKIHIKEFVDSGIYWTNNKGHCDSIRGKFYGYKLISLRDITESECERFVKYYSELYLYLDYTGKITGCNTAKESLISLLQSNGIDTSKNLILLTKN